MANRLRIGIVAPLWERIPPTKYGGLELIVHYVTEELVNRGYDVTLFASGLSKTKAKLETVYPGALYRDGIPWSDYTYPLLHLAEAYGKAHEFDIIHNHLGAHYYSLYFSPFVSTPIVHTYHSSRIPEELVRLSKNDTFVAISESMSRLMSYLPNRVVVYNGISLEGLDPCLAKGKYLIFLGRVSEKKGALDAILAALEANIPLKIIGKVDQLNPEDTKYFEYEIKPLLEDGKIEYLGEIEHDNIGAYLRDAKAILAPIKWEEPFGLTVIEAMACGTPVIAYQRGAFPETIISGETGFLVEPDNISALVDAIRDIDQIDRRKCREHVEKNFTIEKMVDGYEAVYEEILSTH